MSDERIEKLNGILLEAQYKYAYYMLAISAAALAFSIQITKEEKFGYLLIPLGVSVLLWGLSFFLGCKYVICINSVIFRNIEKLVVMAGKDPVVGNSPHRIEQARVAINIGIEGYYKKSAQLGEWQFRALVYGGLSFFVWHLVKMYVRTIGN